MPEAIELRSLTRWYGKRRGVIDLEADVHEGEVFGFLGPNGAGKTTTIPVLWASSARQGCTYRRIRGLDPWTRAYTRCIGGSPTLEATRATSATWIPRRSWTTWARFVGCRRAPGDRSQNVSTWIQGCP